GRAMWRTVLGAIGVDRARKMIDSQEAMTRTIGQTASLDAGELSIGVGPYTADTWMGQVSGRLLQRYPRLSISIHVEPWESLPDLLRRGRVDLFVASTEQISGRKEFRIVEFPEQRGIWICRAGHPLTGPVSPSRSALCDYVMISPQLTPRIRRWLEAGERRSRDFRRHVNTTSVTMIKAMVRQGDAVSLIHPD